MESFIEQVVTIVTGFIDKGGYAGVFFLMLLEACCFPIPSEIVLVSAGYLVGQGKFNLFITLAVGLGGALAGSTITYCAGRFGGYPLLKRYGRLVLLTESRLVSVETWFRRHGPKAVFICRWISGMRAIVSIPAGLCHMPYPKFLLYTALGSGAWVITGTLVGMIFGQKWKTLGQVGHYLLAATVVVVVGLLAWHHFRKGREHEAVRDSAAREE
jgi:membrane protein DedA with SNARE-associated domain